MAKQLFDIGVQDVCRHCNTVVIWYRPVAELAFGQNYPPFNEYAPRWWHLLPKEVEISSEMRQSYTIREDKARGPMALRCDTEDEPHLGRGTHVAEPKNYCVENSHTNAGGLCNRPVVDRELMMCGIHAAHEQKKRDELEEQRARREISEAAREMLPPLCELIKEEFGLECEPHALYRNEFDGRIICNPNRLLEVLRGYRDA